MEKTPFLELVKRYFENDPVAAAENLEGLDETEALEVLNAIASSLSPGMVKHISKKTMISLLPKLHPERMKEIVDMLESHDAASILLGLAEADRMHFLNQLDEKKKKDIQELLTYPEDSAGRMMMTDFMALRSDLTVREAIDKIRQVAQKSAPASYVYVVDHEQHLVGVMNMRDMLLSSTETTLESVMRKNIFSVNCFMDRETVANELSTRRFFAVPVVDAETRLLGIVKSEQLLSGVQEEATEDIQKLFGAGGDERVFSPVRFSLGKRLPWLYVNLATAFLAASVVAFFENIIAKITVLAVYLPVIAGQGGNAGAQSLAVVMRGLVMREIPPHKAKDLIMKEAWIGLVNGFAIGLVTALAAWGWQKDPYLGLVVGLRMLVNLTIAGFSGAAIPIIMKAIGLDPAQCSNIILTTITDVMGFLSFLGFAVLFQNFLM